MRVPVLQKHKRTNVYTFLVFADNATKNTQPRTYTHKPVSVRWFGGFHWTPTAAESKDHRIHVHFYYLFFCSSVVYRVFVLIYFDQNSLQIPVCSIYVFLFLDGLNTTNEVHFGTFQIVTDTKVLFYL